MFIFFVIKKINREKKLIAFIAIITWLICSSNYYGYVTSQHATNFGDKYGCMCNVRKLYTNTTDVHQLKMIAHTRGVHV